MVPLDMPETAIQLLRDLRHEFAEDRRLAKEDRAALYDQISSLKSELAAVRTDIAISGQVDAQVRERLDAFDAKLTNEVMPVVNEVKRWKITGVTALAMVGMGGAAIGSFLWWAWDVIVQKWSGGP